MTSSIPRRITKSSKKNAAANLADAGEFVQDNMLAQLTVMKIKSEMRSFQEVLFDATDVISTMGSLDSETIANNLTQKTKLKTKKSVNTKKSI